ncbi:hypothetical protein B0H14DRAFT_2651644 [Mycena olivaceomarginata]|nr:hypothetical protein B0H14DRAFT_2651644 [Mycena olivaceomarginata]
MLLRGVDRQDGQRILRAGGENDLCAAVHLVLPHSDSALTGFTGIRTDSPASSGSHVIRGHEESWRPGSGCARCVARGGRALSAPAGKSRGSSTCAFGWSSVHLHLLARIESSAMAALLDDEDGEGDAGAGGGWRRLRGASRGSGMCTSFHLPSLDLSGAVYSTSAATAAEDVHQRILRIHPLPTSGGSKFSFIRCTTPTRINSDSSISTSDLLDNSDGVRVIVKVGRTDNLERRIGQYSKCGPGYYGSLAIQRSMQRRRSNRTDHPLAIRDRGRQDSAFSFRVPKRHTTSILVTRRRANSRGAEWVVEAALRSLGQEAIVQESRGRRSKPGSSYGTTLTRSFLRLKNPETNPFKLVFWFGSPDERVVLELFEHLTQKVENFENV